VIIVLIFAVAAIASCVITWRVRKYALAKQVLDIPNARSAHTSPVPRGGGLAIVVVVLAAIGVSAAMGLVSPRFGLAMIGGGLAIGAVGWIDDRRGVAPLARAMVQVLASVWAVWNLDGLPRIKLGASELEIGAFGFIIAVLGIVWLTNAYNFMDGIDGLAGLNSLTVGLGALLLFMMVKSPGYTVVCAVVAGACAGFLYWNWEPARIFMGDVGSGFLGFSFGVIAVASENAHAVPIAFWVLLQSAFIADATITLFRRIYRRERWYDAHNNHAYQRVVRFGYAHSTVSVAFGIANLLLAASAALVLKHARFLWPAFALAGVALIGIYLAVEWRYPMVASASK
jgi:Fuc2NAc and GlcNAc transferase